MVLSRAIGARCATSGRKALIYCCARRCRPALIGLAVALVAGCATEPPPNEAASVFIPRAAAPGIVEISAASARFGTLLSVREVVVDESPPCPVTEPQWWVQIRCARPVRWYGREAREGVNRNLEIQLDSGQRIVVEVSGVKQPGPWATGQRVRVLRDEAGRIGVTALDDGLTAR